MVFVISEFYGMTVLMDKDSHKELSIEVLYGGESSKISIKTFQCIGGEKLNEDAHEILKEWMNKNRTSLLRNADSTKNGKKPEKIAPIL